MFGGTWWDIAAIDEFGEATSRILSASEEWSSRDTVFGVEARIS